MDRILDDEESLRRAEEIYSRRNGIDREQSKKKYFSLYKFLFQLLVLLNLTICFVMYNNKNYIFSEEFLNKVNEIYDINISEKIENFLKDENEEIEKSDNETVEQKEEHIENNQEEIKSEELSKEQIIKESYSFIKPIDGTITSFFGIRDSSNENISGNHTGIDISALMGTKIKSSTDGNVIQVSDKGNYGKHLKIQNGDIITLYAHCKCILVNEGDKVIRGQDIAEVGTTGKSTGPHLHFEIKYLGEYINPIDIIEF